MAIVPWLGVAGCPVLGNGTGLLLCRNGQHITDGPELSFNESLLPHKVRGGLVEEAVEEQIGCSRVH
jgi:hypothetical protein